MSCPPAEPIDPRARRTRKLLQDALRSLVQEKRFAAISVHDITERATVNRATFYAHYVDKHELAISLFEADFRAALMQHFSTLPTLTPENLVKLAQVVFEFLGVSHGACPENARELQDTLTTTLQQNIYEILEHWLSRDTAYRHLFPGTTRETVATVLSWSIYGAAQRWSRTTPDRRPPAEQVCQEIVSILLPASRRNLSPLTAPLLAGK